MAHFAQLNEANTVLQVIVVSNEDTAQNGMEVESVGIVFCKSIFGKDTVWVQTSWNDTFRVRYAGIGFTYDQVRDAFLRPKPYPSWHLNDVTIDWDAPTPPPNGSMRGYAWDEKSQTWVVV